MSAGRSNVKGMPRGYSRPLVERFWEKVSIAGLDDCWEWTASRSTSGYGRFSLPGPDRRSWRRVPAHRQSWEMQNGRPVPEGLYVCHECDNRICVNPAHLFLGTHQDNMDDMHRKGRWSPPHNAGEQNGRARLTAREVVAMRAAWISGASIAALSKTYRCPETTVGNVVHGRTWRSLLELVS